MPVSPLKNQIILLPSRKNKTEELFCGTSSRVEKGPILLWIPGTFPSLFGKTGYNPAGLCGLYVLIGGGGEVYVHSTTRTFFQFFGLLGLLLRARRAKHLNHLAQTIASRHLWPFFNSLSTLLPLSLSLPLPAAVQQHGPHEGEFEEVYRREGAAQSARHIGKMHVYPFRPAHQRLLVAVARLPPPSPPSLIFFFTPPLCSLARLRASPRPQLAA
jgi:hypothetical protein